MDKSFADAIQERSVAYSEEIRQEVALRFPRLIAEQCTIADVTADINDPLMCEVVTQALAVAELLFLLDALHERSMLTERQRDDLKEQVYVMGNARIETLKSCTLPEC